MGSRIETSKYRPQTRTKQIIFNSLGILFTMTGIIGIIVPVLPTTVFFIMAASLFIKTSPGLYRRLHTNRITGGYLRVYTLGEGMSRQRKIRTITLLWLTLVVSALFVRDIWWLLLILSIVGVAVSWHILTIRPRKISPEKRAAHDRIMFGNLLGETPGEVKIHEEDM